MKLFSRRWRRALTVALAVAAILVGFAVQASASQPGEDSSWSPENEANNQQVPAQYGIAEATGPYGHTDVFTNANNQVTLVYNNGREYTWTNSRTEGTPAVIWSGLGWRVFHTGTDGHIYYSGFLVNGDGSISLGNWVQVPGNVVTAPSDSPTVTTMWPNNTANEEWMLGWLGTNDQVYTQYHFRGNSDPSIGTFDAPVAVPNATSGSAPSIAYARWNSSLYISWNGQDSPSNVYMSYQNYGNASWSFPQRIGQGTPGPPGIGADTHLSPSVAFQVGVSEGQVAVVDTNGNIILSHVTLISDGSFYSWPWSEESTAALTNASPYLEAFVSGIVILALRYVVNGGSLTYGPYWKVSGEFQ